MSEPPMWRVVPASDPDRDGKFKSWQMFRKYDGIEEFFGGFWPNEEDAIAEAKELNALEAKAQAAEAALAEAIERGNQIMLQRDRELARESALRREAEDSWNYRKTWEKTQVLAAEGLLTALTRWRSLLAEHDLEDLHPLTIVNAIGSMDAAIAQAHAAGVTAAEAA